MPSSFSSPTLPSTGAARRKALAGLAAAQATASAAPSEILPRLYLSGYSVAADEAQLLALGVTHVVSVLEIPPAYTQGALKTLHVRIEDSFRTDILQHLDGTTEFIKSALEENESNKVLVHCLMGISRSTTVVCAYLIATNAVTATEAVAFVTKRRNIASPNIGFRSQLETYSARYCTTDGKTTTVKRITRRTLYSTTSAAGSASPVPPPQATEEDKETVPPQA